MKKCNLVTIRQAMRLKALGFNEPCGVHAIFWKEPRPLIMYGYPSGNKDLKYALAVPTVDEAIDWLRKKHDVIIYDRFEPVVDPVKKGRIMYCHAVKFCDRKHGWNFRETIDYGIVSNNIYASKRYAINEALKYIEKKYATGRKNSSNRI